MVAVAQPMRADRTRVIIRRMVASDIATDAYQNAGDHQFCRWVDAGDRLVSHGAAFAARIEIDRPNDVVDGGGHPHHVLSAADVSFPPA